MTANLDFVKPLRSPSAPAGVELYWARITQTLSAVGETWTVTGVPVLGTLVAYNTKFTTGGSAPLYLRPELGNLTGFTFGDKAGTSLARFRRQVEAVQSTSPVPLLLTPTDLDVTGLLFGRSGLSRNLVAGETLVTDLIIRSSRALSASGQEGVNDWEIGGISTYATLALDAVALGAALATANTTESVPVDGADAIELWLDFADSGGGTADPSDIRVRWEHQRVSGGNWARVLSADIPNTVIAAGAATIPNYEYEVQDALGSLTLPGDFPFSRHYVLPVRNWSGRVRAVVWNEGAVADGADVDAYFIVRGR